MTREQKIAKACRLKAAGVRVGDIAKGLGVSYSRAYAWAIDVPWPDRECYVCGNTFTPDNGNQKVCCGENARKRWHEKQALGSCEDCGAQLGAGSGYPGSTVKRCPTCHLLREAERVDKYARKIEAWWLEGLPLRQIAARLGWSVNHLHKELDQLRGKGYHLPYRNRHHKNAPAHSEQVAA